MIYCQKLMITLYCHILERWRAFACSRASRTAKASAIKGDATQSSVDVPLVVSLSCGLCIIQPHPAVLSWAFHAASVNRVETVIDLMSLASSVLPSKTRRFLAVHMHQHTQEKMLPDTPVGGRHTRSCEAARHWSKVEFVPMSIVLEIGARYMIWMLNEEEDGLIDNIVPGD
ncbi:hypothetical protein DY000_02038026 [Brassica cretica]|uniref:Uncharacterized protein n=1 Tax=Brassica cretica TaxID=69181 RepID=A0ABQ7B819_BRACR|nr:hypothetical protein DY000_02038026 [Brassica cretica]